MTWRRAAAPSGRSQYSDASLLPERFLGDALLDGADPTGTLVLFDALTVAVGSFDLDSPVRESEVEAVSPFLTRGEDGELLTREALRDLDENVAWPTAVPVGSWFDAELFDTVSRRPSCGHVETTWLLLHYCSPGGSERFRTEQIASK